MRRYLPLLAFTLSVAGASRADSPTKPAPKPPPTPKEIAWRVLSSVHVAIGKAQPAVQPYLLLHLAESTVPFNRALALTEFRDSFADARIMGADYRVPLQAQISAAVAPIDVPTAMDLVRTVRPNPKQRFARDTWDHSVEAIDVQILGRNRADDAVELIKLVSTPGIFPNQAASSMMRSLPAADDRRLGIFGYAATCYRQIPFPGFSALVQDHWRTMPRSLVVMAANAVADEAPHVTRAERITILGILKEVDPPRAERLLSEDPDLADLPAQKPRKPTSDEQYAQRLLDRIAQTAKRDPARALSMADQIRDPDVRKDVVLQIASNALNAGDDPTVAAAALQQLLRLPEKEQRDLAATLANLAVSAGKPDVAKHYVDVAFDFAARLLEIDLDAKSDCGVNSAPKDWWPSTAAYRAAIHASVRLFQTAAEPYLGRLQDTDLYLLMNVEFARALLGLGPTNTPQLTCSDAAEVLKEETPQS